MNASAPAGGEPLAGLTEAMVAAGVAEWLASAEAKRVDSPEGHVRRLVEALMPVLAATRDVAPLTAAERAQFGQRAGHFPPNQLVYSLTAVEAILADHLDGVLRAAREDVARELICGCVEESGGIFVKGVSHLACLYAHFAGDIIERRLRAARLTPTGRDERCQEYPDVVLRGMRCVMGNGRHTHVPTGRDEDGGAL